MKLILFFVFLISSFCMCGCEKAEGKPANTFCYKIELKEDGCVCQTMEFPTYCQDKNEAYITELTQNIENKLYNNFYLNYYLISIKNSKNEDFYNIKFVAPHYEKEKIIFSFEFEDKENFNYFNCKNELCFDLLKTEEVETAFPFLVKSNDITLGERFYSLVNEVYEKYYIETIDAVLFEYSYITPYSKIHSNADYIVGNQHSWVVEKGKLNEEKTVKIWVIEANRGWWYLITIICMLLSFGIYCFFGKKNRKKSKINLDKRR